MNAKFVNASAQAIVYGAAARRSIEVVDRLSALRAMLGEETSTCMRTDARKVEQDLADKAHAAAVAAGRAGRVALAEVDR